MSLYQTPQGCSSSLPLSPTSQGETLPWHPQFATSNNSCETETHHSHCQPQQPVCHTEKEHEMRNTQELMADGATYIADLIFYSAAECKYLRDQIKHSQMHLSWISVPHCHFIFFKKSSSAVQVLPRIHLITLPRAKSFSLPHCKASYASSSHCRVESGVTGNNLKWEFQIFPTGMSFFETQIVLSKHLKGQSQDEGWAPTADAFLLLWL